MLWRLLILLLLTSQLRAQTFNAAPLLAMGNTGLAQESLFSLTNNPSGIARIRSIQVGAAYQNHFLNTEIQSQAAFVVLPFSTSNAVGLSMNNYGLKGVSTVLTLRGTYAKRFGDTFSSSLSVNYHRYHVRNYHNDQTASLDLGLQYYYNEELVFGLLARNVTSTVFRDDTPEYIPEEYGIGGVYQLSEQLQVSADVYHNTLTLTNFRGGVAFWFDPRLVVRGGASSHPTQYYAGLGLLIQKIQVDIASSFHSRLGTSPQLAISYEF